MLLYAADHFLDLGYVTIVPDAPHLASDEVWRWFITPFLHGDQLGYGFVALVAVGIFGTLLERRFGPVAVVATFILAGAAGAALAVVLETPPLLSDTPAWTRDGRQRRGARPARAPGSWTTGLPRAAATTARTTCWAYT